jgi:hypothetical protein
VLYESDVYMCPAFIVVSEMYASDTSSTCSQPAVCTHFFHSFQSPDLVQKALLVFLFMSYAFCLEFCFVEACGRLAAVPVLRAESGISRPRELSGKRYASYGARYEGRIVQQLIKNDGGDGEYIEDTSIGMLGIWKTLLSGKADATWVFTAWEGVMAEQAGASLNVFHLDEYKVCKLNTCDMNCALRCTIHVMKLHLFLISHEGLSMLHLPCTCKCCGLDGLLPAILIRDSCRPGCNSSNTDTRDIIAQFSAAGSCASACL